MKLLLTSGGLTNKSIIAALQELVGKPFNETKLAFIPTAANIEAIDKGWLIDNLVECKNVGFKEIDIVDISALPRQVWQPRLENADILFFGGGSDTYLMYWIEKSGLEELLPKFLETKVYVGLSAGSMVTASDRMPVQMVKLLGDAPGDFGSSRGLALVNFLVVPHLNSDYFTRMREENVAAVAEEITSPLYALDDQSAVKVIDGQVEVVSEGKWKKYT